MINRRNWGFILVVIGVVFFSLIEISALEIKDDLHLNIQVVDVGGNVLTGNFDFQFDIATDDSCSNVVYSDSVNLNTDSRGIISYYLEATSIDYDEQYYLCYYRNSVLIDTVQIARTPYSFTAKNVNVSGIVVDSNLNMSGFNVSADYLFGDGSGITNLFVPGVWIQSGNDIYYNSGTVRITPPSSGDSGIRFDNLINGYSSVNWISNNVGYGLIAGGGLAARISPFSFWGVGTSSSITNPSNTVFRVYGNGSVYADGIISSDDDVCISNETCLSDLDSFISSGSMDLLDGYDSSFFMPLNRSVYGDFDFNSGWTSGGVSIIDGAIYAQSGYFYDINALSVTSLEVNGSMIPDLNAQFDLGSNSMKWRDAWFSRSLNVAGTIVNSSDVCLDDGTCLSSVESSQNNYVLKSGDTMSGSLLMSNSVAASDEIQFYHGATRMGEIGVQDTTWLRINQVTNKNIYTPRYIRADEGFFVDGTTYGISGTGILQSNTGATIGGNTAWHAGNDGAGSGLDADTLDGYTSSDFMLSGSSGNYVLKSGDTMIGDLIVSKTSPRIRLYDSNSATGSYASLEWDSGANQGVALEFNEFDGELPIGGYGLILGPSSTNTQFPSTGTLTFNVLGEIYAGATSVGSLNKVWHAGNDGAGSGLNADLLDGYTSSDFMLSGASGNYVLKSGDTMTGNLRINSGTTPTIFFDGAQTGDFAIRANGEDFEIFEPEDSNKVHLKVLDDTGVNAVYGLRTGLGDGVVRINSSGDGSLRDLSLSGGDLSFTPNGDSVKLSPIFTASTNTRKSYISFSPAPGSNDPGFIMHETSSVTADANKGVLHLSPSDDNDNVNDYVTIHGTNDPETIKLYTGGNINTPGIVTANAFVGDGSGLTGVTAVASGGNADTVDNLHAASFLRSDSADTFTGKLSVGSTNSRDAGMYGTYDSSRIGHIWSMGTGYSIPADGSTFGNLYGLAYKHSNNPSGGTMANGHQVVWTISGVPKAAMGDVGLWTSQHLDLASGNGNGVRFWSSDSYKISMGNTAEYQYGPVGDYSIKTSMSNVGNRGWTWGVAGSTPVAAIGVLGDMQIAGTMTANAFVGSTARLTATTDATPSSGTGVLEIGGSLRLDGNEIITNSESILYINNDNQGSIQFDGGTLFVNSDEDSVGIGTTAPQYKTDIVSAISGTALRLRAAQTITGSENLIRFTMTTNHDSTGAYSAYIGGKRTNAPISGANALVFGTSSNNAAPTQKMIIDSTGKVGIGTDSPLSLLSLGNPGDSNYLISADGLASPTSDGGGYFRGLGVGIRAESPTIAIIGKNSASAAEGRLGHSGYGVWGSGPTAGIYAESNISAVHAVETISGANARLGYDGKGVYGAGPTGVYGTGTNGVYGTGYLGVYGVGNYGVQGSGSAYDFYAIGAGTNYGSSSSFRWKENITVIDNALEKVMNLDGVYFDWNGMNNVSGHDMGFIAEEIGEIIPEIVQYENASNESNWYFDESTGEKKLYASGLDYGALTPVLVEAIKMLKDEKDLEIEKLEKTIREQNNVISDLIKRVESLEKN